MTLTLKKQQAKDDTVTDVVNDFQGDVVSLVQQLNTLPALSMKLLTGIALTTSPSLVAHNLGYEIRGFFVVNKTASTDVYLDASLANPDPLRFTTLSASVSATISLMVF